jgi:hypothetical protein
MYDTVATAYGLLSISLIATNSIKESDLLLKSNSHASKSFALGLTASVFINLRFGLEV